MGKRKDIIKQTTSEHSKNVSSTDLERINGNNETNRQNPKKKVIIKKHLLLKLIKDEFNYTTNLFEVLDIASLKNQGRRKISEEDEDSESLQQLLDVPEQKVFKKQGKKKATTQVSSKRAFPETIEGLEKELEELKGTPMSYQKKLRKKGLQSRLVKKKRKEERKAQKQNKTSMINGAGKLIKPVFNNDGQIVSNKFDFADSEPKKENKRKPGNNDPSLNNTSLGIKDEKGNSPWPKVKLENNLENSIESKEKKPLGHNGPLFNKDNKMVFSKVFIPDSNQKHKKKGDKDPKKILQQLKENKKKILELKKEDMDKAVLLQEKQKWAAALKRASGEKVKDDPELLKKSIAKEKNKKMRSKTKWQARIDRVQKDKEDRQKKRTDNIQARKSEKKKKKMKKAVKRGSYVQV